MTLHDMYYKVRFARSGRAKRTRESGQE